MTSIFKAQFTIGQIAEASGVSANTIRQWFKRGVLRVGMHDREAEGAGLARYFSGATAIQIAIMGALIGIGTPPRSAERAGSRFAHSGSDTRPPCNLYSEGETVLIVGTNYASVAQVTQNTSFRSVFSNNRFAHSDRPILTTLKLDELVITTGERLGIDRAEFWPTEREAARQ